MTNTAVDAELKVADEVWIAAALLHRAHPEARDFAVEEIVQRAKEEGLCQAISTGSLRPCHPALCREPPSQILVGIACCLKLHRGAGVSFAVVTSYHPDREGAKITPKREDLPFGFNGLIAWYRDWSSGHD